MEFVEEMVLHVCCPDLDGEGKPCQDARCLVEGDEFLYTMCVKRPRAITKLMKDSVTRRTSPNLCRWNAMSSHVLPGSDLK